VDHVERSRRGGGAKGLREAEVMGGKGATTFWSTPDGLHESWRQHRGRQARGKPTRGRQ